MANAEKLLEKYDSSTPKSSNEKKLSKGKTVILSNEDSVSKTLTYTPSPILTESNTKRSNPDSYLNTERKLDSGALYNKLARLASEEEEPAVEQKKETKKATTKTTKTVQKAATGTSASKK